MAPLTRAQRREDHATQRRLQQDREQLQREPARAQRSLHALEPALVDWGVPEPLATAVQWRLQAVGQRLGKSFGLLCPTLLGCRTDHALTRVRGWEQHLPSQLWGARPTQQWLRQWPPRGHERLVTWWHQVEGRSPAPRSRWPWTWVRDDRVGKQSGPHLGLGGSWCSGQEHRVRLGIDGLRLSVVIGEGKRVMPVDCTVRRPDPRGPGRPCRAKLTWVQVRLVGPGPPCRGWGACGPPPWSSPSAGVATRSGWRTWRTTSMGPWS